MAEVALGRFWAAFYFLSLGTLGFGSPRSVDRPRSKHQDQIISVRDLGEMLVENKGRESRSSLGKPSDCLVDLTLVKGERKGRKIQ